MRLANRTVPFARYGVPIVVTAVAVGLAIVLSQLLSDYYVFLAMTAVATSISMLGLGIVTGSAGMIALCQLSFAAVGALVVSALSALNAPGGFVLWLLVGAIVASAVGVIVGLPALRLRGVSLAVVTLGFAAAVAEMLTQVDFPGVREGLLVSRPTAMDSDPQYLQFELFVLGIAAICVVGLQRSRWGAAWASVGYSERGTAAAGQRVWSAKLSAFAIAAALGGVSGGLMAGQVQMPQASAFAPLQSLAIYVLALVVGAKVVSMALVGGLLWVAVPEILKRLGVPLDWAFVVFAVLGMQSLVGGKSFADMIPGAHRKPTASEVRILPVQSSPSSAVPLTRSSSDANAGTGSPVLKIAGLGVRYGPISALDSIDIEVARGTILGLIGPNGAGKSTFIDAVSGFIPDHSGSVWLEGVQLDGMGPTERARLGLRRTFQQDRVPPNLRVVDYVRFVARRKIPVPELTETLAMLGVPGAATPIQSIDAGSRRILELVGHALSRPNVLLLDEPAAGLGSDEHSALAARLLAIRDRFDLTIVLVEHDLELIRAVCDELVVLDFGHVLASGGQADVLSDPAVSRAYMGDEDLFE